jgi:hypothetical protein
MARPKEQRCHQEDDGNCDSDPRGSWEGSVEKFLFRTADIFNARELEFGKFFDLDRWLWLGHWLESPRQSRLPWKGLVRVAAIRCVPTPVRVDLRLTEASQIVVDSVFGIEAEVLGVSADESAIENTARELIELLLFNRLQHSRADLGDVGNVVEREFLSLARLAELVAELAHVERPFVVLTTS